MNEETRSKHGKDFPPSVPFAEWKRRALRDPAFRKAYEEPDDDPFLEIAHRLTALRLKRGLTQTQLARKVGTSQQAIARLERLDYRGYTLATLQKLAGALDRKLRVEFV